MMIPTDKLKKFERGEIGLEAFNADERAELETIMAQEVVEDEAPVENPTVKEVAPDSPPVLDGTKVEEVPKGHVPGDKFKEKADEANTYRQRAEAFNRQLEEAKAETARLKAQLETRVENPIKDPNRVWDENHQMDMAAKIARLEAMVESGVRGSQEKLQKLEKELADNTMYAEVDAFQAEFDELRLGRPFKEANKEYIEFTRKLGATASDLSVVDKYFADATFRAEQEAKGIKAPKDYDRLSRILETFHAKNADKYPDYRSAYLSKVLSPAALKARYNAQYLAGAEDVVNKISGNRQETALLDGTKPNSSGMNMSEAQMDSWLRTHPYPRGAEVEVFNQIQEYLRSQSMGQA